MNTPKVRHLTALYQGFKLGLYGAASGVTCGQMPGQLYHEDIDAATYAEWGIDYLKSDNCASYALDSSVRFAAVPAFFRAFGRFGPHAPTCSVAIPHMANLNPKRNYLTCLLRFGAMRDALNRTGKPIVFSIEPFSIDGSAHTPSLSLPFGVGGSLLFD